MAPFENTKRIRTSQGSIGGGARAPRSRTSADNEVRGRLSNNITVPTDLRSTLPRPITKTVFGKKTLTKS